MSDSTCWGQRYAIRPLGLGACRMVDPLHVNSIVGPPSITSKTSLVHLESSRPLARALTTPPRDDWAQPRASAEAYLLVRAVNDGCPRPSVPDDWDSLL